MSSAYLRAFNVSLNPLGVILEVLYLWHIASGYPTTKVIAQGAIKGQY